MRRLASMRRSPYTFEVVAMSSCRRSVFTSSSSRPASLPQALTVCRKLCHPMLGRPAANATGRGQLLLWCLVRFFLGSTAVAHHHPSWELKLREFWELTQELYVIVCPLLAEHGPSKFGDLEMGPFWIAKESCLLQTCSRPTHAVIENPSSARQSLFALGLRQLELLGNVFTASPIGCSLPSDVSWSSGTITVW
jgi:hypothetical protein